MAGSITVTSTDEKVWTKYSIAWVSDASGDVSANTLGIKAGELVQVGFTPDGGGTQPTDLYDVVVNDGNGADILEGTGANLSNTAASTAIPAVGTYWRRLVTAESVTPVVSNAGNAKGGTIDLFIR